MEIKNFNHINKINNDINCVRKTKNLEEIQNLKESLSIIASDLSNILKDSNILDYNTILNKNKIKNEEFSEYILKNKIKVVKQKLKQNFNDFNFSNNNNDNKNDLNKNHYFIHLNLSNIKNFSDYNKNLLIIQLLKLEDLNLFTEEKKKFIQNYAKNKLNAQKYYSDFLKYCCSEIKNKENHLNYYNKNNDFLKLTNSKTRYVKNDEEKEFLENYFEKNKFKWDTNIIKKLSKKWLLSEYSIYRWNWNRINKKPKNKIN